MSLAPSPDEIEISIFGKGFGECLVIHPGNSEWIIVDSFRDPYSKVPVAIEYLKNIQVDCQAVKAVVATHWHDDHIEGLSEIITQCSNAQFICSVAIKQEEVHAFAYSDVELAEKRPGKEELYKILEVLLERELVPIFAQENTTLIRNSTYQMDSLSPSNYAILLTKQEMKALLPKEKEPRKGISLIDDNNTSVVLLLRIQDKGILLGADLMESGDSRIGWSRVLDSLVVTGKSHVFKIPHHGSDTAHHDEVWNKLVEKNVVSVLTSWKLGGHFLPTRKDMRRILSFTQNAWITTNPTIKKKPNKRDRSTERTVREVVKSIHALSDKGQIRVRIKGANPPQVELFESALSLTQCLSASN